MKETTEVLVCDICKKVKGIKGQQEVEKCIVCGKDICSKCSNSIELCCTVNNQTILDYKFWRRLRACENIHSNKDIVLKLVEELSKFLVKVED